MKYTPFLVVIPYLASAAQGRELEYAIAGWRRHFKEDFLIVLTGENLPHIRATISSSSSPSASRTWTASTVSTWIT